MSGGFGVLPCRCHFVSQSAVKLSVCCPCLSILTIKRFVHFAIMCIRAVPPASLGCCSVENGTLKVTPFQIKYDNAAFICLTQFVGGGGIFFFYHPGAGFTTKRLLLSSLSAWW